MRGKNLWIGYLLPGVIAAAVLAGCGNKTADSQLAKTGSEESVQDPAGQTALQPVRNTEDTEFTQRDGSGNNILMRAGIIPRPLGRNKLFQITRR